MILFIVATISTTATLFRHNAMVTTDAMMMKIVTDMPAVTYAWRF